MDGAFRPYLEIPILGKLEKRPTKLDPKLNQEVLDQKGDIPAITGVTLSCNCFYEGQGRIDGAICEYTESDKMKFLKEAYNKGVRNIEMEGLGFAAFCNKIGTYRLISFI